MPHPSPFSIFLRNLYAFKTIFMKRASLESFFGHLGQYVTLSEEEFGDILSFFEEQQLAKKEILMHAGGPCTHAHVVLKGCMHMYFVNEKGVERTVQFALENWWLTDLLAFQNKKNTDFFIQAVEKSEVLSISLDQQERLLEKYPQLERYFRMIYQTAYGASLIKMKYLFDFSKEDIYFHFTESFPNFAQRVPQYLIASFLGLTPEYVSEIRAKRRS